MTCLCCAQPSGTPMGCEEPTAQCCETALTPPLWQAPSLSLSQFGRRTNQMRTYSTAFGFCEAELLRGSLTHTLLP